jgi:hypothetical protein
VISVLKREKHDVRIATSQALPKRLRPPPLIKDPLMFFSGRRTDPTLSSVTGCAQGNSVVQVLLGIDATCRYVRSEENRFMDVGSRFDCEDEFQQYLAEWEKEHGRSVVQLDSEVPGFLREMGMGGDEVNYESSLVRDVADLGQVDAALERHHDGSRSIQG